MAAASRTTTKTREAQLIDDLLGEGVRTGAESALSSSSPFWQGVEYFIKWLRTNVREFFVSKLMTIPVVGQWAARIGATVTEFLFTVIGTFCGFMKVAFSSATLWAKAHASAMLAWEANESLGLLAQSYAYGKKMASYFLEIINQCLQRAIAAQKLQLVESEKDDIKNILDGILD